MQGNRPASIVFLGHTGSRPRICFPNVIASYLARLLYECGRVAHWQRLAGLARLFRTGAFIAWPRCATRGPRNSETLPKLLMLLGPNFLVFSERRMKRKGNCSDFDSAIPWFESRRPSQQYLGNIVFCILGFSAGYHRGITANNSAPTERGAAGFLKSRRYWNNVYASVPQTPAP